MQLKTALEANNAAVLHFLSRNLGSRLDSPNELQGIRNDYSLISKSQVSTVEEITFSVSHRVEAKYIQHARKFTS